MKLLDLPDHPRSTVYAMVVAALKADPVLKATIGPSSWRTYLDEPDNDAPPAVYPAIEALPFGVGASPESLVTQQSPLGISLNVVVDGLDVRDLLNLWGAVEDALFRGDGTQSLSRAIRTALSGTRADLSDIRLTSPAITPARPEPGRQFLVANGTIFINMVIKK